MEPTESESDDFDSVAGIARSAVVIHHKKQCLLLARAENLFLMEYFEVFVPVMYSTYPAYTHY